MSADLDPDPGEAIVPRHTLSQIRRLLSAGGVEPKNKLGQNFLIDLNLIDLIVRTADLSSADLVLEVGSGTGSLTARLAAQAGAVVSVEVDPALHAIAARQVADRGNVRLLRADALKNKNRLNPAVLEALGTARAEFGCNRFKLVANLPYAVAMPVMANLLVRDEPIERMVVTVQWEIAERLAAEPGTAAFGAASVLVQSLAEVTIVRKLAPSVFWPRPKVDSAIVRIDPDPAQRARIGDVAGFRVFLRDLYVHRRKNLRGALSGWPTGRRDKTEIDRLLADLQLDGAIRAEQLSIEQHQKLWRAFAR